MKKALIGLAAIAVAAGLLPVNSAQPGADMRKLRGGLRQMLELGFQPDQRLAYLVSDFRHGDFVVYVVTEGRSSRHVRDVAATGARVRWALRSVNAVSAVASRRELLDLASKPWVRALYPVLSGRIDDTNTSISGTITRGDAPAVHDIPVASGSRSITIDLLVAPPGQPHLDANALDFLEVALVDPNGRTVMDRPNFLGQIAFKYGEPDALQTGTWKLVAYYRQANFPTVPVSYTYSGSATVSATEVARDEAAVIPAEGCSANTDANAWKKNANLKKRGVTDLGAPVLWDRGIRGRGVRVAVLDTGTDASHIDLDDQDFEHWSEAGCAPKVIANALFLGGQKLSGQGIYDLGGHGTHVTGEISGTAEGTDAATRGTYPGVAPETSIIAGRIAIDVTALTDDMLAAGEWAVIDQQADVLNLSFGIDVRYGVLTDRYDPQSLGFEALATNPAWGHPSIMVSAGNSGDRFFTIGAPAVAPHVNTIAASVKDWDLAIGANETREDQSSPAANSGRAKKDRVGRVLPAIANFSSRGPTQDLLFAPDFAAPGRYIVATKSNLTDPDVQNGYASFSGTSMAAPHAAGSAALLVDGYRRAFGTSGAFGNRPPFWIIAAAMSNTAFTPAPRPAFAGGKLAKVAYPAELPGVPYQLRAEVGARENTGSDPRSVGSLVEGAGRVNVVAALDALTQGVLVYTAGNPTKPAEYELQPNLQLGTAKPTQTVVRTLRLDPQTSHAYSVSFRAVSGTPSINARAIPPSWWTLPDARTIAGTEDAQIGLTVPAGTLAGLYTGYVYADIRDETNGRRFTARLPALVSVEVIDLSALEGVKTTITGYAYATDPTTFLTLVALDAVNNDWPTYALEVPKNLQSLKLDLTGVSGEEWDIMVYDKYGVAVADTFRALPGAASLTLTNLAPGQYRVVVSRTLPDPTTTTTDPRGAPYTLTVDLVGAASVLPAPTQVQGRKRTRPKPSGGSLPSTGVPDTAMFVLAILGLASAGGIAFALRRR